VIEAFRKSRVAQVINRERVRPEDIEKNSSPTAISSSFQDYDDEPDQTGDALSASPSSAPAIGTSPLNGPLITQATQSSTTSPTNSPNISRNLLWIRHPPSNPGTPRESFCLLFSSLPLFFSLLSFLSFCLSFLSHIHTHKSQ
jgi:hypothetical protein